MSAETNIPAPGYAIAKPRTKHLARRGGRGRLPGLFKATSKTGDTAAAVFIFPSALIALPCPL